MLNLPMDKSRGFTAAAVIHRQVFILVDLPLNWHRTGKREFLPARCLFYWRDSKPFSTAPMEQKEDAMEKSRFQNFVMLLKSGNFDSLDKEMERANDFARSIKEEESIDDMTIVVEIA